ncbi:MFS transporter [Vibrio sonorensis]|uniref:MFS transporter n=1 Tax=Vibrio sonorensis TaxID=1004316 RepID=UPI0008DAE851|nr:MFS transporter [Vibrio sonorensis]
MFRFLSCSFLLVLLYPTGIDLYLVGLPQIAADLSTSESHLHLAFSIYLAGMATTMLFAGKLADKVGRKPIAIAGALIFTLFSLFTGQDNSSAEFFLNRFAQGIGAGSCYVVAFAILRDSLEEQARAKVMSMINGITCVVPVIAPVIGHLIMLRFEWPSLFAAMGGMGMVVLGFSLLILRETKPKATQLATHIKSDGKASFFQPLFLSRLAISSLAVVCILTYVSTSPMVMMTKLGLDRAGYSTAMAAMAVVSMCTSFSAPVLLKYWPQQRLILVSQLLLIGAGLTLTIAELMSLPITVYFIGFSFICMGFSIGFGVTMSQALSPFSANAGFASSLLGISQVCASSAYIWLGGIIDANPVVMLCSILLISGISSLILLSWSLQQQEEQQYEKITGSA